MWFVIGLIVGIGLLLMAFWLRSRHVNVAWYEWMLIIAGLALLLFGIQNYLAASSDLEPNAPGIFLLVFGLPGVLLLVIAAVLIWWSRARKRRIGQPVLS